MRTQCILESLESRRLLTIAPVNSLQIGDTLYYAHDDGVNGTELWKSNLDGSGATLIKDISNGLPGHGSNPDNFIDYNGTLLFTASGDAGNELYRSDGTPEGTQIVKNIYPVATSASPHNFSWFNGKLLFIANPSTGNALYITDGTADGTERLSAQYDVVSGYDISGNTVTFTAFSYHHQTNESWESDGTVAGTTQVPALDLTGGILRIRGTDSADSIVLSTSPGNPWMLKVIFNGQLTPFKLADVSQISIDARGGSDLIDLSRISINSKVYAGAGNDTTHGSATADRIYGGDGDDWISAGAGNDIVYGENGNDRIFGEEGKDYIVTGAGSDVVRGGGRIDTIFGDKLIDDLKGNVGDQILAEI
ncbi:MAG TPA: hypothetical protein VH518_16025 [Tepidisphaeraceae bacterium]